MKPTPFSFYVEARRARRSVRGAMNSPSLVIMGGFIPGETNYLDYFTEAKGDEERVVSKTPVLFDEHDIAFLLQFPPIKWKEALVWRYGEGLMHAAKSLENSGKIPEEMHLSLNAGGMSKSGAGTLEFRNLRSHMAPLIEKLTKPRRDGGIYEFDLSNWRVISAAKTKGEEQQLHTPNFTPLTETTANSRLGLWRAAMPTGFLGRVPNARFEATKKVGKPSSKVLLDWNGNILNHAGGEAYPVYGPSHLKNLVDPKMIRGSDPDKAAEFVYSYLRGGTPVEEAHPAVPMLMPGRMYASAQVKKYEDLRQQLQELFVKHASGTPLAQKSIIHLDELAQYAPKLHQEAQGIIAAATSILPHSGTKDSATPVSPEEHLKSKLNANAVGVTSYGGYEPLKMSKMENPVDSHSLAELGMSRQEFEAVVQKHFLQANNTDLNVVGPDGRMTPSPLWAGIHAGLKIAETREPRGHVEALREEAPTMFNDMKFFFQKLNGIPAIVAFVKAVKAGATPEQLTPMWEGIASVARRKANTYVQQVSQLDLGFGTRALRQSGRSMDSGMGDDGAGGSHGMIGGTSDVDDDPDSATYGQGLGITRSQLPTSGAPGKKTGRAQSGIAGKITDNGLSIYWGSGVSNLWKAAEELDKLRAARAKAGTEEEAAQLVSAQARIKGNVDKFMVLDSLAKQGDHIDFEAARREAKQKAKKFLASKGVAVSASEEVAPLSDQEKSVVLNVLQKPETKKTLASSQLSLFAHMDEPTAQQQPAHAVPAPPTPAVAAQGHAPSPLLDPAHLHTMNPRDREDHFASPAFTDLLKNSPAELARAKQLAPGMKSRALIAAIAKAETGGHIPMPTPTQQPDTGDEEDMMQYRRARGR
jgi:hypothetical protein